jgi:PAS domain S-box-containing protein
VSGLALVVAASGIARGLARTGTASEAACGREPGRTELYIQCAVAVLWHGLEIQVASRNISLNRHHGDELSLTLFEEAGDALFLFVPETEQLLDVNPMAQRLSGYSRQDLLRMQITYLFRSEVQGGLQRLRLAYRKTGVFHSQEGFLLRHARGGVWIPVNLTITRLHTQDRTLGLVTVRDLREQREMYAQVKKAEAELRSVLSSVSDGLWSAGIDRAGELVYRYYSPVMERITGRPQEFFAGGAETWLRIVPAEDRPRVREALAKRRGGYQGEEEYRILRPDGTLRWVRDSVQVTETQEGCPNLDGVLTDITERKEAELALQASEERFRALVEKSAESISLLDARGTILYTSPSTGRILGYALDELLGRTVLDLVHPDDLPGLQEFLARCLRHPGVDKAAEFRYRHKNGSWRSIEGIGNNRLDDPSIRAIVSNCRDVTERQRAQEAVRASEAKYRTLIENLEQGIFLKDRDLRFVAVNRFFSQGLGLPESAIVGKNDFEFYPRHLAEKYQADDRRVLTEGRRLDLEEQNISNGQTRTVRVIKTPVKDDQARNIGVLGIFWDVTEQRALEAQLRQAQKMEAVGQLAGGVAHDFNNLLTVILGNISLLQTALSGSNGGQELLVATEKAALRAAELTSKLLGFSRRTPLRLEPTNLNCSIDETVALLGRTIDPRISLVVEKGSGAWPVRADVGQLNQVLMNLCINARDAMPDGGQLLLATENVALDTDSVRFHLEARTGEFVRLRVQDMGQGIPPEVLPRIFEPFFTTKPPGKGTGLGLAMVFGIVKQHQGWIDCSSKVGEGTRFDIYLPRYRPRSDDRTAAALPPSPRQGHETILLADDEPMIRNLGRTILHGYGYRVLLAEDGQDAVDVFRSGQEQIDLVILDLTMPRLSGRDAFQQIIQIDPDVRILFASGYSSEHAIDLKNGRVQGFIGKPYRPDDLGRIVRQVLDRDAATTK